MAVVAWFAAFGPERANRMCSRAALRHFLILTRWKVRNRSLRADKRGKRLESMTTLALATTCSPAAFAFATSVLGQTTTRAQNSRVHRARQFGGTHSARLPWTFPCC